MPAVFRARRTSFSFGALLLALAAGCEEGTRPFPEPDGQNELTGGAGAAPQPENPEPGPSQMTDPSAPLGKLSTADGMIRIMAIGDSITRATCWRASLWDRLNQNFAGRFDLVGTLTSNDGCVPANFDPDNQGYSSSLITEIVAGIQTRENCNPSPCPKLSDLQEAFLQKPADVALMHFGTNDVWNSKAPNEIVAGYTQVVAALRAASPKIVILVAQIIPMNVPSCAGCVAGIPALNTRIVTWAAEQNSADSPIRVVDQFDGYDATNDNRDGVHPNAAGSQKMADHWYEALAPLF